MTAALDPRNIIDRAGPANLLAVEEIATEQV